MIHGGTIQRVDGKHIIKLAEGVTRHDFEDWLNEEPHRKELEFTRLPEKWTSAEDDESES